MDDKELKDLHTARGRIYAFFGNVFMMQPDETFFQMIEEMAAQLAVLSSNKDISYGVDLLNRFMAEKSACYGADADDFNMNIQRKYTYIMCLPENTPQEESYYTSSEHLLNQEAHDEMVNLFAKYNIALNDNSRFTHDHIGIELKFMSFLSYKSGQECGDSALYHPLLNEQYNFHINHFDKWLEDFFKNVSKSAGEEDLLYNGLIYAAKGFIQEDKAVLNQLLLNS